MITQKQLNIIANCVCTDSSGESRSAKTEMALSLFPHPADAQRIRAAISLHPIEQNWDAYVKCPWDERSKFLLPEA